MLCSPLILLLLHLTILRALQDSDAAAEEEQQQQQQHYCIVCEKRFRSAGQLANHERSRAHREALAALMEVLQEEEAWLLVRFEYCHLLLCHFL
jgi:hypothetical protein